MAWNLESSSPTAPSIAKDIVEVLHDINAFVEISEGSASDMTNAVAFKGMVTLHYGGTACCISNKYKFEEMYIITGEPDVTGGYLTESNYMKFREKKYQEALEEKKRTKSKRVKRYTDPIYTRPPVVYHVTHKDPPKSGNKGYLLILVHLQSEHDSKSTGVRTKELEHLLRTVKKMESTAPPIILGDFNWSISPAEIVRPC